MKRPLTEDELKAGTVNGRKILQCELEAKTLKVGKVWDETELSSKKREFENLHAKESAMKRESL